MKRQQERERHDRLSFKTLDQQFQLEVVEGLDCSFFEAKALVQIVKQVYFPFFQDNSVECMRPGQFIVQAIDLDEPAGKPIMKCKFKNIILTLDNGADDLNLRQCKGIVVLRRERIKRVAREAFEQGCILTAEDLAYKILNAGYRTIVRDLEALRKSGSFIPLRSTQKDIGRTTTHKEQIVRLWLQGYEPAYISRAANHSVEAVSKYLEPFKRVTALTLEGRDKTSIAFLVGISKNLVDKYQKIFRDHKQ